MFLKSAESIATKIEALISSHSTAESICIAVAFWGNGAEKLLSRSQSNFRVICNLRSGGTNPSVIRSIKELQNIDVKQLDSLHAKVIFAQAGAVVSSANFSTNGLGWEGFNTWVEGGIFVPPASSTYEEISHWYSDLWKDARIICEEDLIEAENAWSKRKPIVPPAPSKKSEQLQDAENEVEDEHNATPIDNTLDVQTVHFIGRIKPQLRNLRSAAAILALNGENGEPMPFSAFVFLFSGGRTRRAFENHQEKFEVSDDGSVRLKNNYTGYFVGTDRTMESCEDSKRRKSADSTLLAQTVSWMLRKGPRPVVLEGEDEQATFSGYPRDEP